MPPILLAYLILLVFFLTAATGTPAESAPDRLAARRAAPIGKETKKQAETMLTITSKSDVGPMEINLCSLGIRMRGKLGSSLWRAGKPGIAILINPENKTFFAVPVDDYVSDLRDEDFPRIVVKTYKSARAKLPAGFSGNEYTIMDGLGEGPSHVFARITGLKNSGVPESTHRMWCHYTGISGADLGLPVSIYRVRGRQGGHHARWSGKHRSKGGKLRSYLVPVELKRGPVDRNLYSLPKGYKEARDRASFYLSQDGDIKKSDLEDFFRVPLK